MSEQDWTPRPPRPGEPGFEEHVAEMRVVLERSWKQRAQRKREVTPRRKPCARCCQQILTERGY